MLATMALERVDLRELCEGVAQELERLACHGPTDRASFLAPLASGHACTLRTGPKLYSVVLGNRVIPCED
jgi:hypothetical protein